MLCNTKVMERKYEALDQTLTRECGKVWELDGKATNSAESKGVMSYLRSARRFVGIGHGERQRNSSNETDRHCEMKQRLPV